MKYEQQERNAHKVEVERETINDVNKKKQRSWWNDDDNDDNHHQWPSFFLLNLFHFISFSCCCASLVFKYICTRDGVRNVYTIFPHLIVRSYVYLSHIKFQWAIKTFTYILNGFYKSQHVYCGKYQSSSNQTACGGEGSCAFIFLSLSTSQCLLQFTLAQEYHWIGSKAIWHNNGITKIVTCIRPNGFMINTYSFFLFF